MKSTNQDETNELLTQVLEQMKVQNKFLKKAFGDETDNSSGIVPVPEATKNMLYLALKPELEEGLFEFYNKDTAKWEAKLAPCLFGKLINMGTCMQKGSKAMYADSLKLYLYIQAESQCIEIKTSVSSVFVREFIHIVQNLDDTQLGKELYITGKKSDETSQNHNGKVVFPQVWDNEGVKLYVPEDAPQKKMTSDERSKDWKENGEGRVEALAQRIRTIHGTIEPCQVKKLKEHLKGKPPIEKIRELKEKLDSDPETIAKYWDVFLPQARYAVNDYLRA